VTAAPAGAATQADFDRLGQCESGGNYSINTGNGFYGKYQFDAGTWHSLGYSGLPSNAAPAVQDEAAHRLYDQRGWSPWPACSSRLGLTRNGPAPSSSGSLSGVVEQAITPAEPPMTLDRARAQVQHTGLDGMLTSDSADEVRPDAMLWQNAMREKRFILTVDGRFGQQSQGIADLYSYLTKVTDGKRGAVGPNIWNATVNG
jgi:hypothetical protein